MSPTAGAVDVFITAANVDLGAATPVAANLATHAVFAGQLFAAGTYQIRTVAAARAAAVNSSLTPPAIGANGGGRS